MNISRVPTLRTLKSHVRSRYLRWYIVGAIIDVRGGENDSMLYIELKDPTGKANQRLLVERRIGSNDVDVAIASSQDHAFFGDTLLDAVPGWWQ